jgi:RHS repeat-associated protein
VGLGLTNQAIAYTVNDRLTTDGYDANGSTTNSAGVSYQYDAEARLTNSGSGVVMVYDGDGNRRIKTVSGTTTWYVVDTRSLNGYAQVIEELDGFGVTPSRLYTHGLDLLCQRQSNGTTHYYGYDGNGNVRYLTAANATVSDTYVYDAFGTVIASTGSTPNNYRYSGEQYDPNLGFYYLRARYLNPGTGRFWSRDSHPGSLYDPPSLHRYTYCANNPVNCTDPSGHEGLGTTLTVIGVAIGIAALVFVGHRLYTSQFAAASRLQVRGRVATPQEVDLVKGGLRAINVHPKVNQLLTLLEGTDNASLTIWVLPGDFDMGSHNKAYKHQLFIPENSLRLNDGGIHAAMYAFGEFQHDALGGQLTEAEAQRELEVLVNNLLRAKPWIRLPHYRHGTHAHD